MNIDDIPEEFFQLAAKAATRSLLISGITGIFNNPEIIKDQMKYIQDFETETTKRSQEYYCKHLVLK